MHFFVEHITGIKFNPSSNELLEKDIKEKINLYSFMNYKIYDSVNSLIQNIKELSSFIYEFSEPNSPKIFSEVVLILNNKNMDNQIEQIRRERIKDKILNTQSNLNPLLKLYLLMI